MRSIHLIVLSFGISAASHVGLPSVHSEAVAAKTLKSTKWWAQVDDKVFYAPPSSFLGLSQNVSDYYYVMGSKAGLSEKMKDSVVGSHGRVHIMHSPHGVSMLQTGSSGRASSGDRRASHSAIKQLTSGAMLNDQFPSYPLKSSYVHPLDAVGQATEKAAVAHITSATTMDYLQKLTSGFETRSFSNPDASDKVEHFLQNQFSMLGMHTCFHTFDYETNKLTNVIAHVQGTEPDSGSAIVGAHYDSRPFDGKAPGAEDNGSGVAALLAMAKALSLSKIAPKKSVYFVAFAGEEPGLVGSEHFASAMKEGSLPASCKSTGSFLQLDKKKKHAPATFQPNMHHAIIMDEIGWASPKLSKHTINLESYDGVSTVLMDHLRNSCETHNGADIDVVHNAHPFGSDHMSFLNDNVASVLTINGDDEAYPHYHQSSDTIENVNGDLMASVTKMNMGALLRLVM